VADKCTGPHHWVTRAIDGVKLCALCKFEQCAPNHHDFAINPMPTQFHPHEYEQVCRTCGVKETWSPVKHDPADDFGLVARKHGHTPHVVAPVDIEDHLPPDPRGGRKP
jgi:hypothetical protein